MDTHMIWDVIAAHVEFGREGDDVGRMVFKLRLRHAPTTLPVRPGRRGRGNHRLAVIAMHPRVEGGELTVEFENDASKNWALPDRSDKQAIKRVRDAAVAWAKEQGATDPGQTNAVKKALTAAGYYLR